MLNYESFGKLNEVESNSERDVCERGAREREKLIGQRNVITVCTQVCVRILI